MSEEADFVVVSAEELRARRARHGEKPRLLVDKSSPDRTVAALRDHLVTANSLYDRGRIVKIAFDQTKGGSIAHVMTPDALVVAAHAACRPYVLQRKKGGEYDEVDVPLPRAMATMYQDWRDWGLPPLNGIATAPLLGEGGSIRTARGYDAATGLWCEAMPDVVGLVPVKPTKDEAASAVMVVRDIFKTFCFADAATMGAGNGVSIVDLSKPPGLDESAFLAGLMTAVCRQSLWLAPGMLLKAAQHSGSGAGKGLLARCICAIAFGRQPFAVTAGGREEEQEKRIAAELIEGGPSMFLDNFNNVTLQSGSLASALTERPARVRIFGKLETIPVNAIAFVVVTGNGIVLSEDLVRRFIEMTLDPRMEDAEQRRFPGDILADVTNKREELLTALLTVWRWGRIAGATENGLTLGSYAQWCSWVRDPLVSLGCRDPVERVREAKRRDPRRQALVGVLDIWWDRHGPSPIAANDLHEDVKQALAPQGSSRQYLAAQVEKLAGTRIGGYTLMRWSAAGKWSAATYTLEKAVRENLFETP